MEEHYKRILAFLRQNDRYEFETSDIAFYLKMDEVVIDNALKYLQAQKAVIALSDYTGKISWHANDSDVKISVPSPADENSINEQPVSEAKVNEDQHNPIFDIEEKKSLWPRILVISLFGVVFIAGVFAGKWYIDEKYNSVKSIASAAVPMQEYVLFRDKAIQEIHLLQKNISNLYSKLDSANYKIDSLNTDVKNLEQKTRIYLKKH